MIKILNREALVECLKNICGNVSKLSFTGSTFSLLTLYPIMFTFNLFHIFCFAFFMPSRLIAIGVLNKAICASIFLLVKMA